MQDAVGRANSLHIEDPTVRELRQQEVVVHPVPDHLDTDDQRTDNWSAKLLQRVVSLRKAAKKLQPAEEIRREFRLRRYRRAESFVLGMKRMSETLTPCFQGECPI